MSGIVSTFWHKSSAVFITERLLLIEFYLRRTRINHTRIRIYNMDISASISPFLFPFSICAIIIPHALKFLQNFSSNLTSTISQTDLLCRKRESHIHNLSRKSAYFPIRVFDRLDFSCTYVDLHLRYSRDAFRCIHWSLLFLQLQIRIPPHRHFYALLIYYMNEQFRHAQSRNPFLSFSICDNNISKTNKNIFI